MALPKVGVEAVIEGMAAFEADSKKVNRAFDDMDTGASKLGKGATGLTSHLTNLGTSLLKIGALAGGAALVGVTALAGGLATFAVGGIKQAIDLDQQVANIAATMGATRETAGTLKDELKGLALDLSLNPNLTVDVTQAGEAIEVLAANGALATDEFGKLTQASKDLAIQTVALANATGSDFGTAATIATDAANIFGLEADEMGKAVDGAAGIMNASKFAANDYQLALSAGGAVTAGFGVSLEEFNTVVAGTASVFASGSDAGTSFKTLMQRLANPTDEAKGLMDELGISLFDAEGNFRGMDVVVGQLHSAFNGMTDAQKAQTASIIGGADASRILLALSGQTADGFNTLSDSVNRSGQGMEAAALRVDTVKGAMDIFKGVLQAIQIQVGDAFLPLLKELAVSMTQFATQNGPMIVGFFEQVASSIDLAIAKGMELFAAFQSGGTGGLLVALGMAPETLALIQATFDSIVQKFTTFQQVYAQFGAMGAGVSLLSMLGLSSDTIALITTSIQAVVDGFNGLANWWITTWPIVQAAALTGWEVLRGIFAGFQTALGPILTQLNTQFTQVFNQIGGILGSFGLEWSDVWTALLTATQIVAAGIGAAIVGIIGVVAGLASGIASGISAAITMFQGLATNVTGIFTGLTTIFVGWIQTIKALLAGDFAGAFEGLKIVLQGSITFWSNMWGGMITVATGSLDIITSTISGFVTGIVGFFQGLYNQLVGSSIVPDLMNAIVRFFAALPQRILSALGDLKTKVTAPFIELGTVVKQEVGQAFTFLVDEILPLMVEGFDFVTEGVKNFISSIREAASTLADMVIPDWLQTHSPPPLATAFDIIAGSAGGANAAITGMMDSLASNRWDEIRGDVLDLVDDMQDEGFYASRGFGKSTGFAIKQAFIRAFTANFQGILSGTVGADALLALTRHEAGAYAERVTGDFGKIIARARAAGSQMLQELKQELLEILPSAASGLSGLASQFVEMLEPQMSDRAKFIKKMQDFLASGSDELFRFDFAPALAGTDHVMLNRLRTQEQLNYLLAEQRKQEIEITKQKEAQQKLSFLQAQIDLIKIGRELGGNIFQGITFGLHADAEDLLAATNRVVEAMIGQIHTTLEIGSPSQIMVEVGQQIMAGLQRGIVSMTPTLNAQLSASVMGPLSPMMAGAMSAGATTNNYNTFQVGGNSINNGVDAATFEARVLQVIRKNL